MSIYNIFSLVNISFLKSISKCFKDCIYPTSYNPNKIQKPKNKIHLSDIEIDSCEDINETVLFLPPIPPPLPKTLFKIRKYRTKKPKSFKSIRWDDYVVL